MKFYLNNSTEFEKAERKEIVVLFLSDWDDWFSYSTLYTLYFFDKNQKKILLGSIKIGQKNMSAGQRSPNLPNSFDNLDSIFFSIGQDSSYYEVLNEYGEDFRENILRSFTTHYK
jgi:hypothetical protein